MRPESTLYIIRRLIVWRQRRNMFSRNWFRETNCSNRLSTQSVRRQSIPQGSSARLTVGKNAVNCWDADSPCCELPSDLRGYKLIPKACFNHVWFLSKDCGFLVLVTDLQILERESEKRPFE